MNREDINASSAAAEKNSAAGIVKIQLDDDQLDQWKEAARSVVDDRITNNGSAFDAGAMYQRMLELAAE